MKEAQATIFSKFDKTAEVTKRSMDELCREIKETNKTLALALAKQSQLETEHVHMHQKQEQEVVDKVLENQPVGWLNKALKKMLANPIFWFIVVWSILKIIWGEYPQFFQATRPYMKPVIQQQQELKSQMEEQHRAMHVGGVSHLHDEDGHPVTVDKK